MAEWYYALGDQKQKGPVPWETLQNLADSGKLQRSDMVWKEGMTDWKKASQVEGLFAGSSSSVRPRRRSEVQSDPDFDDDERPRRRKKRKKEMSPGAMVAIIGGSVGGGILLLVIIIALLIRSGSGAQQPVAAVPVGGGGENYNISLRQGENNSRTFNFQQGQRVEVFVRTSQGILQNPDVDLFVTRLGDPGFEVADEAISKDCYVQFIAPATDQYVVRVENLGPGSATSVVTVR